MMPLPNASVRMPVRWSVAVMSPMRWPACLREEMGSPAHRLSSARDGDVGGPQHDRLGRRNHRLHAASAQAVRRQRLSVLGHSSLDRRDARQIGILGFGQNNITEHDVLHPLGRHVGARASKADAVPALRQKFRLLSEQRS
jgi:hypothetical protein